MHLLLILIFQIIIIVIPNKCAVMSHHKKVTLLNVITKQT